MFPYVLIICSHIADSAEISKSSAVLSLNFISLGAYSSNMSNLNVAVIGPADFARELGKKGTVSDITLYDLKQGKDTVTFIEASKYPERLAPLFFAVSMADSAMVVIEEINSQLGECIVMLHAAGISHGYIILRNYLTPEQIAPLIKGTVLESYTVVSEDMVALREQFLSDARTLQDESDGACSIPIDHFFNVKGVGTVILGYVAAGKVSKHEDLKVLPTDKTAQVRSIQKHDDDYDEAFKGDRVGLALKNVTVENLDRGDVLTSDPSIKCTSDLETKLELVPFWKSPIKEGMVLHIGHWMQFIPSRVESVSDEGKIKLTLEKPMVHLPGDKAVVMYLDGGKLRIVGSIPLC